MGFINIRVQSKQLEQRIKNATKAAETGPGRAMFACVMDLAGASAKLAPIETGDLRSNCHGRVNEATVFLNKAPVPAPVPNAPMLVGTVGYSLPYALRQHEDLTLDHTRSDGHRTPAVNMRTGQPNKTAGRSVNRVPGGEAKFLEKPFEERKDRYVRLFESVLKEVAKP